VKTRAPLPTQERPPRPYTEIDHDLFNMYCHMGEALEVLQGVATGQIDAQDVTRLARRGAKYLSDSRDRLEQIRLELRAKNIG